MKPRDFFFGSGQVSPFGRFVISLPLILLTFFLVGFLVSALPEQLGWLPKNLTGLFWFNLLLLPALLALFTILLHVLDQKLLGSVGFAFHERWPSELGLGLGLGGGMILAVAWMERLLRLATFSLDRNPGAGAAGAFFIFLFLIAAASEELVFRGYAFQRLVDAIGSVGAVVASSALFGFVHLANPFHTWISTTNTALIGFLLAIAYLRTRALWLPLGIHFGWNYIQAYVLGLPVSGIEIPRTLLAPKVHGALWLTGGAYGPEGSILTSIVIVAVTVYLLLSRSLGATRTMRILTLPSPTVIHEDSSAVSWAEKKAPEDEKE